METLKIVTDISDKPISKLNVSYGDFEVNFGNELTPWQVKDIPEVKYSADENTYYTLLMVDPDAPTKKLPIFGEVRHWLVGNIEGCNIKNGDHISAYVGSGPPKKTGLHRYIFLLYKQEGKINFDEPRTANNSRAHRMRFKTRKFVKKYNLGEPIAANFYQAQWDEFVDVRNKDMENCSIL